MPTKIADRIDLSRQISAMERPKFRINSSPAVRVPVREIDNVIGHYSSSLVYLLPETDLVLLVVDLTLRKWLSERIGVSLNDLSVLADNYTEECAILDVVYDFGHVQRHLMYAYTEAHGCTTRQLADVCDLIRRKEQK